MSDKNPIEFDCAHTAFLGILQLLPDAVVTGGSFLPSLQALRSIPVGHRREALRMAQQSATNEAVRAALEEVGVDSEYTLRHSADGSRIWPHGYVGSISHKGTVVGVAMAATSRFRALGIDIELLDESGLSTSLRGVVEPEDALRDLPRGLGETMSFSMKEAAFKAQFPITRRRLGFSDVCLRLIRSSYYQCEGTVKIPGAPSLEICCVYDEPWIMSAAYSRIAT